MSCKSYSAHCFSLSARGGVASTNVTSKGQQGGRKGAGTGRTYPKRPTEFLNEREFWDHFHIPNDVSVHLVDGGPVLTDK